MKILEKPHGDITWKGIEKKDEGEHVDISGSEDDIFPESREFFTNTTEAPTQKIGDKDKVIFSNFSKVSNIKISHHNREKICSICFNHNLEYDFKKI